MLSLRKSFFFIAKSQSLHNVPNQAFSDQRQAIWIGRQCFLVRNKIIIHANKMNALKTVLKNPQIEI